MLKTFINGVAAGLFLVIAAGAALGSTERIDIKDAAGNVIIENATVKDIPRLVGLLDRKGSAETNQAVEALVGFGKEAVPALIEALNDEDTYETALIALRRIKDERAIGPISAFIGAESWDVANLARGALRAYGEAAVPKLVGMLGDPAHAGAAADVLKDLRNPSMASLEMVRPLLKSDNPGQRKWAVFVLAHWKDGESLDAIKRLLADDDPGVREYAMLGYKTMTRDYDPELLIKLTGDENPNVRLNALEALSTVPDEKYLGRLIDIMKNDPEPRVRDAAITAAGETMSEELVPQLIEKLNDSSPLVVSTAMWYLGHMKAKESVPAIMDVFKAGGDAANDESVAWTGMEALVLIGEPIDVHVFLPYLKMKWRPTVRLDAITLIGDFARSGDEEVIKAVEAFRKAEKPNSTRWVKAGEALEKLK